MSFNWNIYKPWIQRKFITFIQAAATSVRDMEEVQQLNGKLTYP